MEYQAPIAGILRYRDDLGQGVRTGVVFDGCPSACRLACHPVKGLIPLSRRMFSPLELAQIIKREDHDYLSDRVNVTLLGADPVCYYQFVRELIVLLEEEGLQTDLYSCLKAPPEALFPLIGRVHLFTFTFLSLEPAAFRRFPWLSAKSARETLLKADQLALPYRLRFSVIKGINEKEAENFAIFSALLKNVKSVILDFPDPFFTKEEKEAFRAPFRKRGVILY